MKAPRRMALRVSEASTLERVNEAGEFKYGSLAEAKESYRVDTFGKIFDNSRQAQVNDDLGALFDSTSKFGLAAAEFDARFLVDLLVQGASLGPTLDDGKRLFHTDHGNLAAAGATISETALDATRLAMRRQKGLTGSPINVAPRFSVISVMRLLLTGMNGSLYIRILEPLGDMAPNAGLSSLEELDLLVSVHVHLHRANQRMHPHPVPSANNAVRAMDQSFELGGSSLCFRCDQHVVGDRLDGEADRQQGAEGGVGRPAAVEAEPFSTKDVRQPDEGPPLGRPETV